MANYYNVTAWKNTGFDYMNRPATREVLEGEYFKASGNYVQFKGVAVKRDDIIGLQYIDLQGSVKDLRGDQVNAPNSVGTHGPDGPWYRLEAIDYLRLVRTGYPGDVDFVDISGNMSDPWNATGAEGTHPQVYYFFVTGLQPMARNVTRLYLLLDTWTTLGGESELEIESGFKIRGHITEAEDAAGYNLAPENIGLLEPLEVKSSGEVYIGEIEEDKTIVVSSIDLTQYSEEDSVDAFVAMATSGQSAVFPAINAVSDNTKITINSPSPTLNGRELNISGYGFFDYENARVQHNLSILYSAGQLELMDSFVIPGEYIQIAVDFGDGRITSISNNHEKITNPTSQDITGYPRKADYLYGQDILMSMLTGDMNAHPFYELSDRNIEVWAVMTPSGTPIARFSGIKDHPYIYDQTVKGMTWMKNAVVMQGASGSLWNQINNAFAQQTQNRTEALNALSNEVRDYKYAGEEVQRTVQPAVDLVGNVVNGKVGSAISGVVNAGFTEYQALVDRQADLIGRQYKEQALQQAQNQLNTSVAQANAQAPYANFVPDLNGYIMARNGFFAYVINTGSKDRQRLKNYFLRYGYNGLYKPLTWDEINVKQRVNYIQAESVCVRHSIYPMRVTAEINNILQAGIFLWNEKPNQAAFSNNPDRA